MAVVRVMQRRRGLTVIEAAIVLPLVLLLLFGVMEYGWIFFRVHQVTGAARHGARVAATAGQKYGLARSQIDAAMGRAGIDDYTVTFAPVSEGDLDTGDLLKVTVCVPYGAIGLNMPLVPHPDTDRQMCQSVSMVKEGP